MPCLFSDTEISEPYLGTQSLLLSGTQERAQRSHLLRLQMMMIKTARKNWHSFHLLFPRGFTKLGFRGKGKNTRHAALAVKPAAYNGFISIQKDHSLLSCKFIFNKILMKILTVLQLQTSITAQTGKSADVDLADSTLAGSGEPAISVRNLQELRGSCQRLQQQLAELARRERNQPEVCRICQEFNFSISEHIKISKICTFRRLSGI